MPILRKQKVRSYTTVDNYIINDKNLSLKGKGLILYMLSKPDDWKFSYKSFVKDLPEGEKSIRSALNELKNLKYLKMERFKDENNRYEWVYTIFEKPFDIEAKNENFEYSPFGHVRTEHVRDGNILLNTNNNKDKEDKQYTSSFFVPENHNRLTLELIDRKYIDKEDLQLFYYDELFEDLLKSGNTYKDLITIVNYVVSRVLDRKFIDEEGCHIKNKFGYLKNAINSNIYKLNNPINSEDLFNPDDYDWLNDEEEDFEL